MVAASYTLKFSEGYDFSQPGKVNVTYRCNDDYELAESGNDTVICVNVVQGESESFVIAEWSTTEHIQCHKGS